MGTRRRAADYAAAVVTALCGVGGFSEMADPTDGATVRDAVARHAGQPTAAFECTVDSPAVANWRLRPHPAVPARVRLSSYRFTPTSDDRAREQRVNAVLDRLGF